MASHPSRSASLASSSRQGLRVPTTFKSTAGRSKPRTAAATTSSGFSDDEIVCAVTEARGISSTIGLAFVDISISEAVLCQFPDTQTFARTCHKIKVFDPSDLIYASTARDSKLLSILHENLDVERNSIRMEEINRSYWSESVGYDYVQQLALPDDLPSLSMSLAGNFFAVCCFAAALKYIDWSCGKIFANQTLRIKFEPSEGTTMIDLSTITSLELVQNLANAKSKDCLYGLLNETLTKMGSRILKSNVLQPSTDKSKIAKRLEAVAELLSKKSIFFAIRDALHGFVDTDRVLAALVVIDRRVDFLYMEQSVNHILMLKSFINAILPIWRSLADTESEELQEIRELCDQHNFTDVKELIDYALNEEVHYATQPTELRNQRVHAIKAGVNGFLDVARQTYREIDQDIIQMVDELKLEHELRLDLKYDPARQYFFKIKVAELENQQMPECFINIHHKRAMIECQTMELIKMNQRLKDAHNEVIAMSDGSIQTLIEEVRSKIHPLFKISEAIAMLDMLAGFAQLATIYNYIKPEFDTTLAVKSGRHPILEKIRHDRYIPNDVYATQQTRFQIITGCNMSGKSTYIRSIALMMIMAQIGCFVPASYASFPIIHQLFARVTTDDSIEGNASTFASEMREMAFILHNIEPRSLVIVDELGRGTSTTDGLAIAIAISEALIESKAFVWFVTHFRDLPRVLAERAGVVNLHLAVDIAPDFSRMKMTYKIADGWEDQKYYGLALASLMKLPQTLIDTATEISVALNKRNEARKQNVKTLATAKRRKLVLKLKEQLVQARDSEADDETLRKFLKKLQEEFVIRMNAIDDEVKAAEEEKTDEIVEDVASESNISEATADDDDGLRSHMAVKQERLEDFQKIVEQSKPSQRRGRPAFLDTRPTVEEARESEHRELAHDTVEN